MPAKFETVLSFCSTLVLMTGWLLISAFSIKSPTSRFRLTPNCFASFCARSRCSSDNRKPVYTINCHLQLIKKKTQPLPIFVGLDCVVIALCARRKSSHFIDYCAACNAYAKRVRNSQNNIVLSRCWLNENNEVHLCVSVSCRSTSLNVAWCYFLHRQASDGLLRNLLSY